MAYDMARKQFQENVNLTDRVADPRNWNLNAGFLNLTEALSQDLADIKAALVDISEGLERIERSQ